MQPTFLRQWRSRLVRGAAFLALGLGVGAAAGALSPLLAKRSGLEDLPTARVRRADFDTIVLAMGRVESTNSTEIRCALERIGAGAIPTVISLAPDGSNVKKGDVLCEIDASSIKEMVRQQEIKVQQARASYQQAALNLEVTEIGARAYLEGQKIETDRQYRGQIALNRSDLNRQVDRTEWTRQMFKKGYASTLQIATEEQTLLRAKLTLAQSELTYLNFERFTAPKMVRSLESQINGAKASLGYETIRLNREEERLANYKKQLDACTVRAPHDGFLIYAGENGRDPAIDLGVEVRQRQKLFTLPDLSQMEVVAILHETVVTKVKPGMPAWVRVEALPGREYEGVVMSISPLPMPQSERRGEPSSNITYFQAKVKLTSPPSGLRPGMTSELEIVTQEKRGVLAIPYTAVEPNGQTFACRVVRGDKVERREVTLGTANHDLREVVKGLNEAKPSSSTPH
ncbi:MAG: efflux RND transporter periplasmic adaptor subunit [Isosphaeraceae bacterium]